MFKALIIWYNNKIASFLPSAIDTMKAELRHAEMAYLENQKEAEEAACNAEMWALKAKHDFKRCKRLQRWIDSEQASIDEANWEQQGTGAAMENLFSDLASAFSELDEAIKKAEAAGEMQQVTPSDQDKEALIEKIKKDAKDYEEKHPLAMGDEQVRKAMASLNIPVSEPPAKTDRKTPSGIIQKK